MSGKPMALEGLKVVDLSTIVAAPTAAELLCAYGADVIKVEALGGDGQRNVGLYFGAPYRDDCNPNYTIQNANKKHIAINLKSEEGKEAMLKLLSEADIFVTNVRMKGLNKMGLGYEDLKDKMPGLIYAHFGGYGPKGPYKDDPGFDSTVFWWRSGMMADWLPDDATFPFKPTYAFGDTVTASSFYAAILMAVIGKMKTGKGTLVECSLYASGLWCNGQGVVITQFDNKRMNPQPAANQDPLNWFYQCKDDGWITINQLTTFENDFAGVCRKLGVEDLLEKYPGLSREEMIEKGYYLDIGQRFREAFRKKDAEDWFEDIRELGITVGYARPTYEAATDEQAIVNGYVEELEFPDGTKAMMPVPPMFLKDYDRRPLKPAGNLGEDTKEILKDAGYDDATIEKMLAEGAVK